MKRKSTTVEISAGKDEVVAVLEDAAGFITNWPYVVKTSTKRGITAEILLPRFVFKFGDTYTFSIMNDSTSYIYDGTGKKSHLIVTVALKEWQKHTMADIELSYNGRGEFLLGKTLEILVNGIASSLKELSENITPAVVPASSTTKVVDAVDFADPMSVASFLAKSKMVHSGLHVIQKGSLLNVILELRGKLQDEVLYVSGVTQDGMSSFKLLLRGSQILAIEYRDKNGPRIVKVENEETARRALELVSGVEGAYMINVWVPVGGV
ncbi:hypothetical protein [Thermococcus sp.]